MPSWINIIGHKNCGKTTLIIGLVEELRRRGYSVGTVKHTSHRHELDRPGKDSQRQRLAGANPAAIVSPSIAGLFFSADSEEDILELIEPHYDDCDIVLVEGWKDRPGFKIEVWRSSVGKPLLAQSREGVDAVISDDLVNLPGVPLWSRSDIGGIVDRILDMVETRNRK